MKYRPGKHDGLIDVALLQKKLDEAATADPRTRDQIERQCRSYIWKMRAKAKQEQQCLQDIDQKVLICEFTSFDLWVSKARSWLGGISGGGLRYKRREKCICLDAKGRVCRIGEDFQRARDEDAFPVKAYRL